MGDSLTEISGYPSDLQTLLGPNYTVSNFGATSSTVQLDTYKPYLYEAAFFRAKDYHPNIAVIMLGTNDARVDYAQSLDNFVGDYLHLIGEIQGLDSEPIVFVVKPPPVFQNEINIDNGTFVEKILPFIEQVADERGLPIIDVYSALESHPEYFQDGVHPTSEGAQIIANKVYETIVNYHGIR